MEESRKCDSVVVRTANQTMRLLYPLTVTFGERYNARSARQSVVRLRCFTLDKLQSNDLSHAEIRDDAPSVFVADETVEVAWPHYFYVLVNQRDLAQNLQRLHWLTQQALLGFQLRRSTSSSSSSFSSANKKRLRGETTSTASSTITADPTTLIAYDYELVLYNVDSSLTSLYDTCSMFDNWQSIDRMVHRNDPRVSHNDTLTTANKGAATVAANGEDGEDGDDDLLALGRRNKRFRGSASTSTPRQEQQDDSTLVRNNNLYRVRLQSTAQYQFLFEYFRDNAYYWQHQFSVPVNLMYDQFRYALDVYVSNLRFKIMRDSMARTGRMESQLIDVTGSAATRGGTNFYRKMMERMQQSSGPSDQLFTDPLDMRRWFACGKWCLFDVKRSCVSIVPLEEFHGCVRTLLGLTETAVPDHLLTRLFATPMEFVPRLVWDIETIAKGKGTIPRGITADQKLSSVALVFERPALDAGRVVVLYVLTPETMTSSQVRQLDLQLLQDTRLDVRHARVHSYTDERAMLLDFLLDMTTNASLLTEFFGVKPSAVSSYHHMVSLLTGYNSIEYDYAFLMERCLFFDSADFAPFLLAMRRFSGMSRSLCHAWVFNEAQLCLDVMQFLQARNRQLKSYKLANVLRVFGCNIEKIEFSAVEIRRLYYGDGSDGHRDHRNFMRDILRYNVFDCLSLCDLLNRLSFADHMTIMMTYFFAPLDVVMYKGNSSLLPTLVQLDNMLEKREMAVIRQPTCNNFVCSSVRVEDTVFQTNRAILRQRFRCRLSLESYPPSCAVLGSENPYTALLNYHRVLRLTFSAAAAAASPSSNVLSFLDSQQVYDGDTTLPAHNEMELLRVGEKTYIGGMNDANPSHSKYPVLADYNSFYPSIIRSYTLDVCKVAVLDLKQILLTIPIPLLESLLETKIFRLFDYTCLEDLESAVDLEQHRALFGGEPWHEAIEYTTFEQILLTSCTLSRRFLTLIYTPDPSTVDGIATKALKRRAVWKAKRKQNPQDVVLEFMELMEKLLANSLYGYMNFGLSAIFSRATAAAVTLLCRNAFCRTRRIIESRDLVATTLLDPDVYRFQVIYIDTDGCIFVLKRIDGAAMSDSRDRPPSVPWFRLYADLDPADTVAVYDRLIGEVNRRLDLQHVTLAAEHYNAFAVCVFAKKKYALLLAPDGKVKKTGFESNAAKPIRQLYDHLLCNTLRAFHIYRLVVHPRFVVTIRHHRLFFYAIFDYMYELWRQAASSDDSPFNLQDFCQTRPLNPKANSGELSQFIDRILFEFRYAAGERVSILRIVDTRNAIVDGVLYPQCGKFVMLEELDGQNVSAIVPNLQFFLGCYTRYFYQCVEGHQTLRESVRNTREPIEPGYYLSSFKSILEYCWACWLFCRVYASDESVQGLYWPKSSTSTLTGKRLMTMMTAAAANNATTTTTETHEVQRSLPHYLPRSFFHDKHCEPKENPFYRCLFAATTTQQDEAEKRRFIECGEYLTITPLS